MNASSKKWFYTFYALFLVSALCVFFVPDLAAYLGDTHLPPMKRPMRFSLIGLFSAMFLFYHYFLYNYKRSGISVLGPGRTRIYFFTTAFLTLIFLCFSKAVLSSDLYEYSLRGRMFGLYGMNPYLHAPSEISGDLFYRLLFWKETPECYGPAWALIGSLHTFFFKNDLMLTVFAHKLVLLVFLVLTAFIFYKLCETLKIKNAEVLTAAFILNPTVLLMTVIDGHNEIAMVFFMLAAVCMLYRSGYVTALLLFTAAVHVKFVYLLAMPFIVLYILFGPGDKGIARRISGLVLGAVLSLGLSALLWSPFGWESVKAVFNYYGELNKLFWFDSVPFAVHFLLDKAGLAVSKAALAKVFSGSFLVIYVSSLCYFLSAVRKNRQVLFSAVGLVLLALLFTNYTPFQTWYLLWAIPFVLLSGFKNKYPSALFLTYFLLMTFWKRMWALAMPMFVLYAIFLTIQRKGLLKSCTFQL